MSKGVPSIASALFTLAGVTWRRFARGRAVWVAVLFAVFPILAASMSPDPDPVKVITTFVMCLLPPVFVASTVGEELEERTSTYLWSRPLPRWTLLVGKLLALAPIATALIVLGWVLAVQTQTGAPPPAREIVGFAAGGLAISAVSGGIGTLVPRHGMALSIVYFIVLDLPVGAIPASVQQISITRHVRLIAGHEPGPVVDSAVALVVIAAVWLAIGLWRVRKLES